MKPQFFCGTSERFSTRLRTDIPESRQREELTCQESGTNIQRLLRRLIQCKRISSEMVVRYTQEDADVRASADASGSACSPAASEYEESL